MDADQPATLNGPPARPPHEGAPAQRIAASAPCWSTPRRMGRVHRGFAAALLTFGLAGPALADETKPADAADPAQVQALTRASNAVLGIDVRAVEGARSADTLGAVRRGSGVVVGPDGLMLTIGYLILEAERIDIVLDDQRRVPARPVAYDLATGFGLVQALAPLPMPPAPLGVASSVTEAEPLLFASGGQEGQVSVARLASRRDFAGYWEYFIHGALFTAPARPDHSGAGLFNGKGELVGIGSLIVADAKGEGERSPGNMFVPIDLLKPIFSELRERGRSQSSTRAWMGLSCAEDAGLLRVVRVARDSPAEAAGIVPGDQIVSIDGRAVDRLGTLWQALWSGGGTEREVRLRVKRAGVERDHLVQTVDRMSTLERARGI